MSRLDIHPRMVTWAIERSQIEFSKLAVRFPKLDSWLNGRAQPTFKQLEAFANATHTPLGFLFLPEPPAEPVPIPDFRTVGDQGVRRPSPNLLDTIYAMQRRQDWLREECIDAMMEPLPFVGSARLDDNPVAIADEMRRTLGLQSGWAGTVENWKEAIGELRQRIEDLGVMAIINGVVGNNTHRKLDAEEFRGFALTDEYAPLIFVNGADAKSAQMFTLVHELAHLWLGRDGEGISGFKGLEPGNHRVEQFCNLVAAEFLVPERELREQWRRTDDASDSFVRISKLFKVSPIVAGRRAMDLGLVAKATFFGFYEEYTSSERRPTKQSSGGNFYLNQGYRVGAHFATKVVNAALEGRITYKHAYELVDLHGAAFQKYARRLGIGVS